ncbi:MAG: PIN domain-containing protein [Actinomycetota bacterium]
MKGATFDSGALIAFERNDRAVVAVVARACEAGDLLAVPAGVVAQVWRDGRRQARLAKLLRSSCIKVIPLDDEQARAVGQLCGVSGTEDIVDASVAFCARQKGQTVLTSDAEDIRRIDPTLNVIPI